jgi:hypothetical protein
MTLCFISDLVTLSNGVAGIIPPRAPLLLRLGIESLQGRFQDTEEMAMALARYRNRSKLTETVGWASREFAMDIASERPRSRKQEGE